MESIMETIHNGGFDFGPKKKQQKKADPFETIIEVIPVIVEAEYEDSDVTSEEYQLSKRRLKNALLYILDTEVSRETQKLAERIALLEERLTSAHARIKALEEDIDEKI